MSGKRRRSKTRERNVVEDLMSALISDRNFQKLWQDEALSVLNVESEREDDREIDSENESLDPMLSVDAAEASMVVDSLGQSIHLAIETFLRSSSLGQMNSDVKLSREAAALYSVRVQVDRLTVNSNLQLPQVRLAARRVAQLLKDFTFCVSKPFPTTSCSFLASSLCDLLYRFEELCSMNPDLVPVTPSTRLRRSIDDFHCNVVKRLNMIMLQRRPTSATTSGLGTSYHSLSNLSSHNRSLPVSRSYNMATMGPAIVFQKSPGSRNPRQKSFLLPPELEYARNRLKRSRSMVIRNAHAEDSSRRSAVDEIENRWKSILSDDVIASFEKRSPREGAESRAALRAACKLTRDVVEEIARRVEKL